MRWTMLAAALTLGGCVHVAVPIAIGVAAGFIVPATQADVMLLNEYLCVVRSVAKACPAAAPTPPSTP